MRFFVILAAVSAVIAMPLPQSEMPVNQPQNQQEGQSAPTPPETGPGITWDSMPTPNPLPEPESDGTLYPEDTPWWQVSIPYDELRNVRWPDKPQRAGQSNPFQDIDAAQVTGDVLNKAWDINAKVLDTIGKNTPLGGASKAAAVGGAALLDLFTGGGVPTVPDVPDVGALGGG